MQFLAVMIVTIYMIAFSRIITSTLLIMLAYMSIGQNSYQDQACVTDEEFRLYKMINEYRKKHNQPAINLSASLCYVAGAHVWDLSNNEPDEGRCNLHSWSDKGPWSECCYTEDHKSAECVWSKPEELTKYDGTGYEVAYFSSWSAKEYFDIAAAALEGWKSSPGHKHMIINKYGWKRMEWNAIGIGIYKNYVVVWFGEEEDPEGKAERCSDR